MAQDSSASIDEPVPSRPSSKGGNSNADVTMAPFSFTPAIFLPFSGLPITSESSQPLTQEQKLTQILQNLDAQQDAVRKNMLDLVPGRVEQLRRHAKEKIAALNISNGRNIAGWEERRKRDEEAESRALDDILRSMRAPPKPLHASIPDEYELRKDESFFSQCRKKARIGDTTMLDINETHEQRDPRTEPEILRILSADLRDLVDHSVDEMVGYTEHARDVKAGYQRALERRVGVEASKGNRTGGAGTEGSCGTGIRQIQLMGRR